MAAESLYLRSTTFTAGTAWLKTYADGLQANDLRLGRMRYTAGESVLAQADSEIGATFMASNKILYSHRTNATGDSSEATRLAKRTPHRGVWHSDDNAGDPASAYSVEGDLLVWDAVADGAWLEAFDGTSWRGLGVLAEARSTATGGSQTVNSSPVVWRSSVWNSGTSAAVDRSWRSRVEPSSPTSYDLVTAFHDGSTWTEFSRIRPDGATIYPDGGTPAFAFDSAGEEQIIFVNAGAGSIKLTLLDEGEEVALALAAKSDATLLAPSQTTPYMAFSAKTWNGSDSVTRNVLVKTYIDSPATLNDRWAASVTFTKGEGGAGSGELVLNDRSWLGLGGSPGRMLSLSEDVDLSADLGDGSAAGMAMFPAYTATPSDPWAVARHNYILLSRPTLTAGATVDAACAFYLDDAIGTHEATVSGDISGNACAGGLYVNLDGTLYLVPLLVPA